MKSHVSFINLDCVRLFIYTHFIYLFIRHRLIQTTSLSLLLKTPWPDSASEWYRPSDRRLSAKLVSTFAFRGCRMVSATDPHGRILGFIDRSRYYFFQVTLQLYSRGRVNPVSGTLPLRISDSAGNRTRESVARISDH
jgi:hypothetical protein